MNVEVIKILAEGCYKSFMTIKLPNNMVTTICISRNLYYQLKSCGAITAQKYKFLNK